MREFWNGKAIVDLSREFLNSNGTFLLFFIVLFDFTIIFSVFMVLIFFSPPRLYPLFHLSGLPFSFFVNNLTFSLLSTFFIPSLRFFIPHRHFTPFSCLSLPLPPVFILFAHVYTTFSPFQSFLPFLNSFLSFLLFRLFHRFTPLAAIFLDRPSFFRFYLCHFPRLIFHVSRLSKCFT